MVTAGPAKRPLPGPRRRRSQPGPFKAVMFAMAAILALSSASAQVIDCSDGFMCEFFVKFPHLPFHWAHPGANSGLIRPLWPGPSNGSTGDGGGGPQLRGLPEGFQGAVVPDPEGPLHDALPPPLAHPNPWHHELLQTRPPNFFEPPHAWSPHHHRGHREEDVPLPPAGFRVLPGGHGPRREPLFREEVEAWVYPVPKGRRPFEVHPLEGDHGPGQDEAENEIPESATPQLVEGPLRNPKKPWGPPFHRPYPLPPPGSYSQIVWGVNPPNKPQRDPPGPDQGSHDVLYREIGVVVDPKHPFGHHIDVRAHERGPRQPQPLAGDEPGSDPHGHWDSSGARTEGIQDTVMKAVEDEALDFEPKKNLDPAGVQGQLLPRPGPPPLVKQKPQFKRPPGSKAPPRQQQAGPPSAPSRSKTQANVVVVPVPSFADFLKVDVPAMFRGVKGVGEDHPEKDPQGPSRPFNSGPWSAGPSPPEIGRASWFQNGKVPEGPYEEVVSLKGPPWSPFPRGDEAGFDLPLASDSEEEPFRPPRHQPIAGPPRFPRRGHPDEVTLEARPPPWVKTLPPLLPLLAPSGYSVPYRQLSSMGDDETYPSGQGGSHHHPRFKGVVGAQAAPDPTVRKDPTVQQRLRSLLDEKNLKERAKMAQQSP